MQKRAPKTDRSSDSPGNPGAACKQFGFEHTGTPPYHLWLAAPAAAFAPTVERPLLETCVAPFGGVLGWGSSFG